MNINVLFLLFFILEFHATAFSSVRETKLNFGLEFGTLGSYEESFIDYLHSQPEHERTVVEFGGGYGRIALKIVSGIKKINYTCTDVSEEQMSELNQKAQSIQFAENATLQSFACDCSKEIDVAPNSVNVVMMANVFHFLSPLQAIATFKTIQTILKPGGRLYIMSQTPYDSWSNWHFKLYSSHNIPFPGYIIHNLVDESDFSYGFLMTRQLLFEFAQPFGLELVSEAEYILYGDKTVEVETGGTRVGMVLSKQGDEDKDAIALLERQASEAYALRKVLHRKCTL